MKKSLLWIVALSFSLVIGQTALAHEGCGDNMKKMIESLRLDDAQKAKVMPILDQLKSSIKASAEQFKDLDTQINQQIQSDNTDQATLDGLMDKKTKLVGDMMKAKANAKHQIYSLLNAQQKTVYQSMVKKWEEKMAAKYQNCHKDEE